MFKKRELAAAATHTSAGEHVAGIEDLILQILVGLPAKSLIRLKLVSKEWFSLISDPKFAQSHVLRRNPSSSLTSGMFVNHASSSKIYFHWLDDSGVTTDEESAKAGPSLDFLDIITSRRFIAYPGRLQILQSCNGLFLCCPKYNYFPSLCVCNPTTKQYRLVHQAIIGWSVSGYGFAFDPSISPHYKLVCVKYQPCLVGVGWTFRVEVYSSEDHEWRLLLEFEESERPRYSIYYGVYFDGGIHWLGQHSFHFDLNSESLVRRPRPCRAKLHGFSDSPVGVRFKYLYVVSYSQTRIYVCEMSNDYSEWVIKYLIHVSHLTSAYPEIVTTRNINGRECVNYCNVFALGVVEGPKEGESELLLLAIPGKIVSYNLTRDTVKTVYNFHAEPATMLKCHIRAFPFIETLSLV